MKRHPNSTLVRWLCLAWFTVAALGCTPKPPPTAPPSQVQEGRLYQSGQSEFDGLFRELHDLQLLVASATEEERQIRKVLALAISVEEGATRQLLADKVAAKAADLAAKKIRIRLEIEGLEADDEGDTMAQAKLAGSLDDTSRQFVEATALAARQELRFAARLRHAQKRIEHLAHHAAALDPWVDSTFGGQGAIKTAEVRRNLEDARRQFPLLTVRVSELSEEARRTVQKLASAMTNDASLGSPKEPPLIAPVDVPPTKRARPVAPPAAGPAKKPAAAPKPAEGGGDFEP